MPCTWKSDINGVYKCLSTGPTSPWNIINMFINVVDNKDWHLQTNNCILGVKMSFFLIRKTMETKVHFLSRSLKQLSSLSIAFLEDDRKCYKTIFVCTLTIEALRSFGVKSEEIWQNSLKFWKSVKIILFFIFFSIV